jgi:hypothetical protein
MQVVTLPTFPHLSSATATTPLSLSHTNHAALYPSISAAFRNISALEGGSRALWRGVNSVVVGAGPSHALHFGVYEWCKARFGGDRVDGQGRIAGSGKGDVIMEDDWVSVLFCFFL